MSLAYEFFSGRDKLEFRNTEDMINFIIDHYGLLMKTYRVMKTQNLTTRAKKFNAHVELQQLRVDEEKYNARTMSETDKITLQEKKDQLVKLREEDDLHYFNGEELEVDNLSMLVINHPKLIEVLEALDSLGRTGLAKVSRAVIEKILTPVRALNRSAIEQTKEGGKTNTFLKGFRGVLASVPEIVSESILGSMDVNLADHLPESKESDENSFSISF